MIPKKYPILILILIICVAAFFRLYKIDSVPPGLYPDEAMNGNNALEALYGPKEAGGFRVFYQDNNGREGLFINIQAMSVKIFGNEPWALRIISALFGIFTALGMYFLTKEIFYSKINYKQEKNKSNISKNENVALGPIYSDATLPDNQYKHNNPFKNVNAEIIAILSSFFLAVSFWHINFSRIGFRAIMAPFFLIWGLYFLFKAFRQIEELKPPKLYIQNSIFSGLVYGLGFYSYIAYRITPVIILAIFILHWLGNKDRAIRKKLLVSCSLFLVSCFLVFLPLGLYFFNHPADFAGRSAQVSIFASENPASAFFKNAALTLRMFNVRGDCNWRHNYACAPQLDFLTGIFFLVGLSYSIWQISQRKNYRQNSFKAVFGFWFLVFGFLTMLSPAILSAESLPHALRAIAAIPFVYIFVGLGAYLAAAKIIKIWQEMSAPEKKKFLGLPKALKPGIIFSSEKNRLKTIAVSGIAILFILQTFYFYFYGWATDKNVFNAFSGRYVQIGKYLNSLPDEAPKYVVVNASGIPFSERYTGRPIPMPAATTMFITDTFLPQERAKKNIHYLLPEELKTAEIERDAIVVYLEPEN